MKKLTLFLLIALTLCILISCSGGNSGINTDTDTSSAHTHSFGEWAGNSATCTSGSTMTRYCPCGEKEEKSIDPLGHIEIILSKKEPTCTEAGLTEGKKCSTCGSILKEQEVIESLGHTEKVIEGKEPTCLNGGLTDGKYCTVCEKTTVEQKVIPAKGHIYSDGYCTGCNQIEPTEGIIYYVEYNGGNCYCTVRGVDENYKGGEIPKDIIIAEEYMGYPVTEIWSNAFANNSSIESVYIPKSITKIWSAAFQNCTALKTITIPNSISSLGSSAFAKCSALEEVIFEEGSQLTEIGETAFSCCTNLKSVEIPKSVKILHKRAFEKCTGLLKLEFEDGAKDIQFRDSVFEECTNLSSVEIPVTVDSNGIHVFSECNIKDVYYDGNIDGWLKLPSFSSGSHPLNNGANLYFKGELVEDIVIPSTVKKIRMACFMRCTSLKTVSFEAGSVLYEIEDSAFVDCANLQSVELPSTIKTIGSAAFYNCSMLEKIVIPVLVDSIDEDAFNNCEKLTVYCERTDTGYNWHNRWYDGTPVWGYNNVLTNEYYNYVINNGEAYLTKYKDDYSLIKVPSEIDGYRVVYFGKIYAGMDMEGVIIQDNIKVIEKKAFAGCSKLNSVTMTTSIMEIRDNAFENCTSLTSIEIYNTVEKIGNNVFKGCTNLTIYLEKAEMPSYGYGNSFNANNLTVVWGHNNVTTNAIYDYVVHNNEAYLTKYKSDASDVIIPSEIDGYKVVYFGHTFDGNESIKKLIIPNTVTMICYNALNQSYNIKEIYIPSSVTYVGINAVASAFGSTVYCGATQMPKGWSEGWSGETYKIIWNCNEYGVTDNYLWMTMTSNPDEIAILDYYGDKTEIVIPSTLNGKTVTAIGAWAFYKNAALTKIVIPSTVIQIDEYAFHSCSALKTVIIPKSVVKVAKYQFMNGNNIKVCCEAENQPQTWDENWNYNKNANAIWGYTEQ